ncbi:hypothetical protein MOSE0_L01926 [Monosporozyma servazzii]
MAPYSILIASNSLSYLCLFIVYYHVLPPLIDERSIISHQIEEKRRYFPAFHPSKHDLVWRYRRIWLTIIVNAGIWKSLSYMDFQDLREDTDATSRQMCIGYFLGIFLLLVYFYVVSHIGPLYYESKINKYVSQHREENTDKGISLQMHELLTDLKMETSREINKLRQEMLAKDASSYKLSEEKDKKKDKENKGLQIRSPNHY